MSGVDCEVGFATYYIIRGRRYPYSAEYISSDELALGVCIGYGIFDYLRMSLISGHVKVEIKGIDMNLRIYRLEFGY